MKKTYIVSMYNNYEWIHTEHAYCKLQLYIKYMLKGYKVLDYPIWFVVFIKKYFNFLLTWGNVNINIKRRIPGSDQVTYYTPYGG